MTDSPAGLTFPFETPPSRGEVIEIADDVYWVRMPLPMKLDHVNVYVFGDDDGLTVVDTGIDTRTSRKIWTDLLAGPLGGRPVVRVVLTHHHMDHVGLAGWFATDHGAEIVTTRTAWLYARMLQMDVQERPTPQAVKYWTRAGMPGDIMDARKDQRPFNTADVVAPIPVGFTSVRRGDVLRFGRRTWDVRFGGGHAPDHLTLWSRDDQLVVMGDQVISSISPNIGVYVTEPNADPLTDWIDTCTAFLPHAREDHLVLSGHKRPFVGLPHRLNSLIQNHETALDRLLAFLAKPATAHDTFSTLFKRTIGDGEYSLALGEAMAHLNHLYFRGDITRETREDGVYIWQARTDHGQ